MSKHSMGHNEIIDSAIDWLCDAHKNTDQWERGQELKKIRPLLVAAPDLLKAAKWVVKRLVPEDEKAVMLMAAIAKAEGK